MDLESRLFLLAGFYLVFLMLGIAFYMQTARHNAMKWKGGNKVLNLVRFFIYVVIIPFGMTLTTGIYLIYIGYLELF